MKRIRNRTDLLAAIREPHRYAELADDSSTKFQLEENLMPLAFLQSLARGWEDLGFNLDYLRTSNKIEGDTLLRAKQSQRSRPIASNYQRGKPKIRQRRGPITYRIHRADRLALWYAGSNYAMTKSRGEAYGLWKILEFWRTPKIQKLWRTYTNRPDFELPPDARPFNDPFHPSNEEDDEKVYTG